MEQGSTIKVRDVNLHVRRAGKGKKLVFLHGAGGVRTWGPAFRMWSERYELIVPDHPGFGLSDNPSRIRTVGDVAMFYLDFFDQLAAEGEKFHLIGHSLGGWIAAELATRNCSRVQSLSLIAPAGLASPDAESGDVFIWNDEELLAHSFHNEEFIELARASAASQDADIAVKNKVAFARLVWNPRLHNPGLKHWLHRVSVPAQLLWGEQDQLLPSALAAEWQKHVDFRQFQLIRNCGHMPLVERADETAELVSNFVDGVGQ